MVFLHLLLKTIHLPMKFFHFLFKSINLVLKAGVISLLRSLMVGIFRTQRFLRPERKHLLLAKTVADERDLAAFGIITLVTAVSPVNILVFFCNFLFRGGIVFANVAETFLSLVAVAAASSVQEKPRFIRYIHVILGLLQIIFQSSRVSPHGVVPCLGLLIRLLLRGDIHNSFVGFLFDGEIMSSFISLLFIG